MAVYERLDRQRRGGEAGEETEKERESGEGMEKERERG